MVLPEIEASFKRDIVPIRDHSDVSSEDDYAEDLTTSTMTEGMDYYNTGNTSKIYWCWPGVGVCGTPVPIKFWKLGTAGYQVPAKFSIMPTPGLGFNLLRN